MATSAKPTQARVRALLEGVVVVVWAGLKVSWDTVR